MPVDATIAASSVTKLAFITSVVGTMKNNKLPAIVRVLWVSNAKGRSHEPHTAPSAQSVMGHSHLHTEGNCFAKPLKCVGRNLE